MLSRPYFKHSTFIPFFGLFFKCQNVQFLMFILFSVCYIQAKGESILQCQSALDSFCSLCRRGEDYQCHDDLLPTQVSSIRNLWKNMKNHCIIYTLYVHTCVYVLDIYIVYIFICDNIHAMFMFCDCESKKRELEVVVVKRALFRNKKFMLDEMT